MILGYLFVRRGKRPISRGRDDLRSRVPHAAARWDTLAYESKLCTPPLRRRIWRLL